MKSFGDVVIGKDELLALGAIMANLMRGSPPAATAPSVLLEGRRRDLGRAFEVAAPSMEKNGDVCPSGRQVYSFLRAVIDVSDVSQSSVVAAFVLVMRLLGSARIGGSSWQLAWLVAICVAQKGLDDVPLGNCEFPTVLAMCAPERAAIDLRRFNRLEHTMLCALGWKTHVPADVFAQVVLELEHTVVAGRREAEDEAQRGVAAEARGQDSGSSTQACSNNDGNGDMEVDMESGVWEQREAATDMAPPSLTLKEGPDVDASRRPSPFARPSPTEISRFGDLSPIVRPSKERAQEMPPVSGAPFSPRSAYSLI